MMPVSSFQLLVFISGLTFLFKGSSSESLEQNRPYRRDLPYATPELINAHKLFMLSSLAKREVERRNLLIAAGIIPHPPEFRSQRHFYETVLAEDYLSPELSEYIIRYVLDIISSDEKLDESLKTLYGVRLPLKNPAASNFHQTMKQSDYNQYSNGRKTKSSLTDNMERATGNYFAPDEDSYTRSTSETGESSSSTKSHHESNRTTSPDNLDENIIVSKPSLKYTDVISEFDRLLSDRISVIDHEVHSGADIVTEHTIEVDDESSQDELLTAEYDPFGLFTSSDRDQNQKGKKLDAYSKTSSENVTQLSPSTVTPKVIEKETEISSVDEIEDSELIPVDVQLIDKVISISADEYIYSVENPFHIESINIKEPQMNQDAIFPISLKEIQKLIYSLKSKQMKEKGELQRQIHKYRGIPGKHFPNYDDFPESSFECHNQKHIPGFYADQDSRCQVFHVCWPFRRESFLCPVGTIFNQAILACDHWYNSNCSLSQAYFDVNLALGEPATTEAGTVGSMVDSLLTASAEDRPIKTEVLSSMKDVSKLYIADVNFSEATANEELSHIYKFLPIKAKILIYPEPEFMKTVREALSKVKRF